MIVVDWGTTNLRVFACHSDGTILQRVQSTQGIKLVPRGDFAGVLATLLRDLDQPRDLPIFVCGMAGARGGWLEAPYCLTPLSLVGLAAKLTSLPDGQNGYLLPGAKFEAPDGTSDVMRGEEIQIFGGMSRLAIQDGIFCLPGTHSKWVRIRDGQIAEFATFMTGDLFQALAHTILACDAETEHDAEAFSRGLKAPHSAEFGLMHRLFSARTLVLDGVLRAEQVSSYVSGLMIGYELSEAESFREPDEPVVLIGTEILCQHYRDALAPLGVKSILLESSVATCAGVAALRRLLHGGQV